MKTLIVCHISTPNLRRIIMATVKNYGFKLARGLFECEFEEKELNDLCGFLSGLAYQQNDCVRIYPVCAACEKKSLSFGQCVSAPPQSGWVIF